MIRPKSAMTIPQDHASGISRRSFLTTECPPPRSLFPKDVSMEQAINHVTELPDETAEDAARVLKTVRDALRRGLRHDLILGILDGPEFSTEADLPTEYDPQIEARRGDYEKLAESLAHMITLADDRLHNMLDLAGWDEESRHHLINGIQEHLGALWQNLDWRNPRTLRKFYAEMRLYVDQQRLNSDSRDEEFADQHEAA